MAQDVLPGPSWAWGHEAALSSSAGQGKHCCLAAAGWLGAAACQLSCISMQYIHEPGLHWLQGLARVLDHKAKCAAHPDQG